MVRTMPHRRPTFPALLALSLALAGCSDKETGPVRVSAIGGPPRMVNPNLEPLDAASAFLLEATAQGLVRFDAAGEIEPALAQSWIVSNDGRRYTVRIRRLSWPDGSRVTANQVAGRLRAIVSRASRSPLKPVMGAMDDAVAMTDQVFEISLLGPRPNMLQLLAQPEASIMVNGQGTGPYRVEEAVGSLLRLTEVPGEDEEEEGPISAVPEIWLRGESAAMAVARFVEQEADLVIGGTIGTLPFVRAARPSDNQLVFDPVGGLFGLVLASADGPIADTEVRNALSMAIDREALVAELGVPNLQPALTLAPRSADELPDPTGPAWAASPLPMRRELAIQTLAELEEPLRVRIAVPEGPGYRLVFAHLRRDWRLVGVEAERVAADARAELRLVDMVAPGHLASWYFRQFSCEFAPVCDAEADAALEAARLAPNAAARRAQFAIADRVLTDLAAFMPITSPVRWSLVSPRLNGFRPNVFARHPAETLVAQEP